MNTEAKELKGIVRFMRSESDKCVCCKGNHVYCRYIEVGGKQTDMFAEIQSFIESAGDDIENKELTITLNYEPREGKKASLKSAKCNKHDVILRFAKYLDKTGFSVYTDIDDFLEQDS